MAKSQPNRAASTSGRQAENKGATSSRPGVDLYVSALSSVRRSGARRTGAVFDYETFNATRRSRRAPASAQSSKPALVSENEYEVLEDWMIDDMNGHYIRPDPCEPKKRSRIRTSRDSSPSSESSSNGATACPAPVCVDDCFDPETSPVIQASRNRPAARTSRDSDDDDPLFVSETRRRSPKRRRLRQTRLVTVTTPSPRSSESSRLANYDEPIIENVVTPANQPTYAASTVPIPTPSAEVQVVNRPASDFIRINVSVDGRKFAVMVKNR